MFIEAGLVAGVQLVEEKKKIFQILPVLDHLTMEKAPLGQQVSPQAGIRFFRICRDCSVAFRQCTFFRHVIMLAALDGLRRFFDSIRANVYKEAMTAPTITVFVCLGSNTPDAAHMLSLAVERLRALPRALVDVLSGIYLTEPQDYCGSPWFHNQVVRMELETDGPCKASSGPCWRRKNSWADNAAAIRPCASDRAASTWTCCSLGTGSAMCRKASSPTRARASAPSSSSLFVMWAPPAASTPYRRNGWPGSSIDRKVREFFSDAKKLLCYPGLR